jgi:branched-chain amino acid transport system substrate-binding protein
MSWESPRGPMSIDPETRDVISNIYLRRVERVNGELWNIEFATVENVKDPVKAARRAARKERYSGFLAIRSTEMIPT